MPKSSRFYARQIRKRYERFANWLPTDPIELGDYGNLENGIFQREGNLRDLGFTFDALPTFASDPPSLKTGVDMNVLPETRVELPGGLAKIDVSLKFTSSNSLLIGGSSARTETVRNSTLLGEQIKKAWANNKWEREWRVVTSLVRVDGLSVFLSMQSQHELKVTLKGKLPEALTLPGILQNPDVSLNFGLSNKLEQQFAGKNGMVLMFELRRLRDPWIGQPDFDVASKTHLEAMNFDADSPAIYLA